MRRTWPLAVPFALASFAVACSSSSSRPNAAAAAALPAGFDKQVDVDLDGRADRVFVFPNLRRGEVEASLSDLPPVLVAHALPEGGFTFDDPVARASLRALCPASPPVRPYSTPVDMPSAATRAPALEAMLLDAYCRRVWGASVAEAVTYLRDTERASHASHFVPGAVEALAEALEKLPLPVKLSPMEAPAWPTWPAPPAERAAAAPSPDARCAAAQEPWTRFAQEAGALLASANPGERELPMVGSELGRPCLASDRGRWTLLPGAPRLELGAPDKAEARLSAVASLAWTPAQGKAPSPAPLELSFGVYQSFWHSLEASFDLDGDGTPEAYVLHDVAEREAAPEGSVGVYTVKDGRVVPYPAAAEVSRAVAVRDVDTDGRPDLVLSSPWTVVDTCGMEGIAHPGPRPVAHALASGAFSTDDEASRAWLRSQCRPLAPGDAPDVLDVACARLSGLDPEAVVAALHARSPAGPQRLVDGGDKSPHCLTFQQLASRSVIGVGSKP